MADRSSAEIFGEMLKMLDEMSRKVWRMSCNYDFSPCQMSVDKSLINLGLAREVKDEDGEDVIQYRAPDGKRWEPL